MRPKVLVIDNDPTFLELMQDLLLDYYDVAVAENVLIATDLLLSDYYDLLILDQKLPVVSGLEFLRNLKVNEQFKNLPTLIISGYPHPNGSGPSIPYTFMSKPISSEELLREIERLLKSSDEELPVI
jgi:response regulator RpfG family c-di-GMP phosphodiesterase